MKRAQKSVEQEGRILLAIEDIQNGRLTTIATVARSFNGPRATLAGRMKGIPNLYEARGTGHKFTQLEEESIQDWLISMDQRGAALTIAMLRDMTNLLHEHRGDNTPPPPVGKIWSTQYIKRHPELTTRFFRKYDYQRAVMEDPNTII